MSPAETPSDELVMLLGALLDGEPTPQEQERLGALLAADADARRHYYRLIEMHGLLDWENTSRSRPVGELEPAEPAGDWSRRVRQRFGQLALQARVSLFVATAATVVLLLTAALVNAPRRDVEPLAGKPSIPQAEPFVAEVTRLHQTQWPAGARRLSVFDKLRTGEEFHLLAGLAEIEFANGARVILEGPAILKMQSPAEAALRVGSLTAVVPPKAIGFSVLAGSVRVVDLGTEFGMRCDAAGNVNVHVFRGSVRADQLGRDNKVTQLFHLQQDDALQVSAVSGQAERQSASPADFVRNMPAEPATRGQLLATDSFDYSAGPLIGHSGGRGWAETWRDLLGGDSHQVLRGRIGRTEVAEGRGGYFSQNGNYNRASRRFDLSEAGALHRAGLVELRDGQPLLGQDGTELFVGFSQRVSNIDRTYYGLEFARGDEDSSRVLSIGCDSVETGYGATSNVNGGSVASFQPLGEETSDVRQIVVRFVFGRDNADQVEIFVDPATDARPAKATAVLTGDFALDRISVANFGGKKRHQIDEIRVADRWATARGP